MMRPCCGKLLGGMHAISGCRAHCCTSQSMPPCCPLRSVENVVPVHFCPSEAPLWAPLWALNRTDVPPLWAPGAGKAKGDLLQVIVAEDMFELCVRPPGGEGNGNAPGGAPLLAAVYRAARAWAGHEEVARGRMVRLIHDGLPGVHAFMPVRWAEP